MTFTDNILVWCRDFAVKCLNFVDDIASLFDTKIIDLLNPFVDIPVVGDVITWLATAGGLLNADWTILEFMFGAGLQTFITFVVVKFVLDVIF